MKRRTYLKTVGVAGSASLAGCAGTSTDSSNTSGAESSTASDSEPTQESSNGSDDGSTSQSQPGVLSTAVSDNPGDIGDFKHLWVTVEEIWVHPKKTKSKDKKSDGNNSSESKKGENVKEKGGKYVISVGGKEVDLVKLQGDASAVISEVELPNGTYEQIKLWVGDETHGVLKDGSKADVTTPGNAPLKFNKEFEVKPDTRTTFVADFSPHKRGRNGYIVKPVASEVSVSYESLNTSSSSDGGDGSDDSSGDSNTTNTTTTTSDGSNNSTDMTTATNNSSG